METYFPGTSEMYKSVVRTLGMYLTWYFQQHLDLLGYQMGLILFGVFGGKNVVLYERTWLLLFRTENSSKVQT